MQALFRRPQEVGEANAATATWLRNGPDPKNECPISQNKRARAYFFEIRSSSLGSIVLRRAT
jgi:hypothetical protein